MADQISLPRLRSWLDTAIAVVVTMVGLVGFAAVSFTEPWQSAVTVGLIGVGTAVAVLFVVAMGWDRPTLLRPATVWLATLAVWGNLLAAVSGALYLAAVVVLTGLVLAQKVVEQRLRHMPEVVTS